MSFTTVKQRDIRIMSANGCTADDWESVSVADGFDARRVRRTAFKGNVRLGRFDGTVQLPNSLVRDAGISDACLHDVFVGDNCYIANVNGALANLDIGDEAVIENVGSIGCTGETSFGNGVEVSVLNEGGGRKLRITSETSAQIAYISVLYRDRSELVARLDAMSNDFAKKRERGRATIGAHARLINCPEITNVCIGDCAVVNNVTSLRDGTIESCSDSPTVIENGVIARGFIAQKGSRIADGAMILSTLVGEGVILGRQFSAEQSVFFANSEGYHSEACSVFAGPFFVTHHRATLLIAGMFSFFNAGSGTNQSNHRYKLGPLHQGILERGCKTGSGAYLVWPSRIGAFSTIIGTHHGAIDTAIFPFSLLYREGDKSILVPASNLLNSGTVRDGVKWEGRDRRRASKKLDIVMADVFSPYTAQKMMKGMELLFTPDKEAEPDGEYIVYQGVHIKKALLGVYARHYERAVERYLGDIVIRKLDQGSAAGVRATWKTDNETGHVCEEWVDVAGLLCEKRRLEELIGRVLSGTIDSLEHLQAAFESIADAYRNDEWEWAVGAFTRISGGVDCEQPNGLLKKILVKWRDASIELLNFELDDARKEFAESARVGFGIDGNRDADFFAVRGRFDDHPLVDRLKKNLAEVEQKFNHYSAMA